jgi:hypothetical protein
VPQGTIVHRDWPSATDGALVRLLGKRLSKNLVQEMNFFDSERKGKELDLGQSESNLMPIFGPNWKNFVFVW